MLKYVVLAYLIVSASRYGLILKAMKNLLECIWMLPLVVTGKLYLQTRSQVQFPLISRLFSTIILLIQLSLLSYKIGTVMHILFMDIFISPGVSKEAAGW